MTTDPAPYVHDIVPECPRPHTTWLCTDDAARLRSAHWSGGPRGTLVVFNGRTEYIEKYAFLAKPLMQHGYTVAMHDWRGHGLSDRLHKDPDLCHVETFASYQADVDAVLAELECRAAPRPYHLIAHSMGGCIGLRTLHRTDAFRSAVVLAPMWGFYLDRIIGGVALALSTCATLTGFGGSFVHGTGRQSYLQAAGIDRNVLTSCTETFLDLRHQIEACPRPPSVAPPGPGCGPPSGKQHPCAAWHRRWSMPLSFWAQTNASSTRKPSRASWPYGLGVSCESSRAASMSCSWRAMLFDRT